MLFLRVRVIRVRVTIILYYMFSRVRVIRVRVTRVMVGGISYISIWEFGNFRVRVITPTLFPLTFL
jgi:hypothetical protein